MARKRKFNPNNFENIGRSNLSAVLYASMLQSPAWYALSPRMLRVDKDVLDTAMQEAK